ncbi:hypothetical protein [Siccirubricoccus phaeus]|uniref:hypothetical protein n=1 Tax=Siccirubricoccus phaeus TaxID=2595053 RepID=UPI0011F1DB47|nr:hypothetical protein [Siccirubricoccus phaeus]
MSERAPGHEYFRHGRFRVTEDIVRARTKSIQLSTIEGVELTRPLFFLALAVCAGLAGLSVVWGDILYPGEIALFLAIAGGVGALAWNVGTLRVFSKLTRQQGWAVLWWITPLRQMRDAIETAIEDRSRGGRPRTPPPPPPAPPGAEIDPDATVRIVRPGLRAPQ